MSDGYSLLSQTEQIDLLIEAAKANWREVECRDAVLAWDGQTFKTHPVTGKLVSDEAAQVPQWRYRGGRQAAWPQADFVVGKGCGAGGCRASAAHGIDHHQQPAPDL